MEENTKIQYFTKFAVLASKEAYNALNDKIGRAKHYPDDKSDTYNYSDPEQLPNWDGKWYMMILPEVQEQFPVTLEGVELVDGVPVEPVEEVGHEGPMGQ